MRKRLNKQVKINWYLSLNNYNYYYLSVNFFAMKKFYLLLLSLVIFYQNISLAQNYLLYYSPIISQPCEFDLGTFVTKPSNIRLYHTINDEWDGPIDSSYCISVSSGNNNYITIDTNSFNKSKALFIQFNIPTFPDLSLSPNSIHAVSADINFSTINPLQIDTLCNQGVCTQSRITVAIPDSAGIPFAAERVYYGKYKSNWDYSKILACIPIEYFDQQKVTSLTYRIKLITGAVTGYISLSNPRIENTPTLAFSEITATPASGSYSYSFNNFWYNHLGLHSTNSYPNANNITDIPIHFSPNPSTQTIADIYINELVFVSFQPFTQLKPDQVNGDTILHLFNLINNGGEICLNVFLEIVVEDDNSFTYRSGTVSLDGHMSCMMFKKGGKMIVDEGSTFHYGSGGMGILAWQTGAVVDIKKNAELIIHNRLNICENSMDEGPQQIYVTLNEGATLTFAPGSRLTNEFSIDGLMKLNVIMNGGTLNYQNLSPQDQQLLNIIYPTHYDNLNDNIIIYQNPLQNELMFSFNSESDASFEWKLIDIQGRVMYAKTLDCKKGLNFEHLNVNTLPGGMYLLHCMSGDSVITKKVIKL